MEFITNSELSFPFVRNVTALTRQTIDRASRVVSHGPVMHSDDQFIDFTTAKYLFRCGKQDTQLPATKALHSNLPSCMLRMALTWQVSFAEHL